jgi:hypothetical protein
MEKPVKTLEEALQFKKYMFDRLLAAEAAGLPTQDAANVSILIDAGEYVVALETLATQIFELDVALPQAERSELEELGQRLAVPVAYLLGDPWASKEV